MAPNPYASGIFYSICQPIQVGCTLYSDVGLTTPAANRYYSDGTWCYEVFGNGVVIAKTSVADCFITTTSTTTSSTTTPSGYYKFQAYILPYNAEDPYVWCNVIFGEGEASIVDIYTNVNDPSVFMVGNYISISESSCQSSYDGLPIGNYQLLWSPDGLGAIFGRKLFRINNLCTVTQEWVC